MRFRVQPSKQISLRLIPMLLQIAHKRRAASADLSVIARVLQALLVDVARRIFEVPRAEVGDRLNIGVVGRVKAARTDLLGKGA